MLAQNQFEAWLLICTMTCSAQFRTSSVLQMLIVEPVVVISQCDAPIGVALCIERNFAIERAHTVRRGVLRCQERRRRGGAPVRCARAR
jgi:hypothetical protein